MPIKKTHKAVVEYELRTMHKTLNRINRRIPENLCERLKKLEDTSIFKKDVGIFALGATLVASCIAFVLNLK